MVTSLEVPGARVLQLPRPDRANALDRATVAALRQVLHEAAAEQIRLLVFASTASAFCAGLDLSEARAAQEHLADYLLQLADLLDELRAAPFVTAAYLDGAAVGAGADLAIACDYRIGTDRATFRFPGSRFGLLLGTWHLARVVGQGAARDILLRNARVDAAEAMHLGLLTSIEPAGGAEVVAERLAGEFADLDAITLRRLLARTRAPDRHEDRQLVAESLAVPGLPERLRAYGGAPRTATFSTATVSTATLSTAEQRS